MPVIAIFDIGKTNKKFFLFTEQYKIVLEHSVQFAEISDEDGFACDDVEQLSAWVWQTLHQTMQLAQFDIRAINFSAYGASLVHIDEAGHPVTPLYSYLKPYPQELQDRFYNEYGGETKFSIETASPVLGSLNSGMQLYRLQKEYPSLFDRVKYSLHLPQYISYLVTGKPYTDITSIGCHTALWNFREQRYHDWLYAENSIQKLAPFFSSDQVIDIIIDRKKICSGIGLHDSSAALIPYLSVFSKPFVLISTGTWCISLNPFNDTPLTAAELAQDCLCYLTYNGRPVKASRLFAGNEHEIQVKILSQFFNTHIDYYKQIVFDTEWLDKVTEKNHSLFESTGIQIAAFAKSDLSNFQSYEEAYHTLVYDIIQQQKYSTSLILCDTITRIFVDGGFAKNPVYMNLLAAAFPGKEIFAASVSQATAIGAAMAIHAHWNTKPVPGDMVELKYYTIKN